MKRALSIIYIGTLCCLTFMLISCSGKKADDAKMSKQDVKKLSCLIVMPARTTVATTKNMKFSDAEILEKGATFLDGVISEELGHTGVTNIISPNQINNFLDEVEGGSLGMLREIGKKVDCNTVFHTTVQRFKQREGGDYAVDSPASAAFEMRLIDLQTGTVLWSGNFNETQESLFNNLFSFDKAKSRGFKWITVETLARQGVHERVKECPYFY